MALLLLCSNPRSGGGVYILCPASRSRLSGLSVSQSVSQRCSPESVLQGAAELLVVSQCNYSSEPLHSLIMPTSLPWPVVGAKYTVERF